MRKRRTGRKRSCSRYSPTSLSVMGRGSGASSGVSASTVPSAVGPGAMGAGAGAGVNSDMIVVGRGHRNNRFLHSERC